MIYLQLFFEFFKVGLFSIGGGMATFPFLMDLSTKTQWFTSSDLANMLAVSESTPGPIGVNMATYVGTHTAGFIGGLIATLGLITPSIIIILIVYYLLTHFMKYQSVKTVLKYLRAAVIGLISYAFIQVAQICFIDNNTLLILPSIILAVIFALICVFKKIHPIVWILLGAVLGLIFL